MAAVKALKVRVLTDAASDLHDQATASAKSSLLASYKNPELLFYTQGSRTERWQAVKVAAKDLLDNPMGHAIPTYGGTGLSTEEKPKLSGVSFWQKVQIIFFSLFYRYQKTKVVLRCRYLMALPVIMDGEGISPVQDW